MTRRNQSLDLLRGVAILLVVLVHCQEESTGVVPGLSWFARNYGGLGVQLFFIISGYTMMLTFGDRLDLVAARSFYIRRFFRIAPLFWVAIVFYLLATRGRGITNFAPDGVGVSEVLLTFFFLHSCSVTAYNSVVPGGWSIAVEMQFYLLFPLLIYLFRRRNGATLCYASIALVSVIGQLAVEPYLIPRLAASLPASQTYLAEGVFTSWLPRQVICFGFGILLYDYIELKNRPTFAALVLLGAALIVTPQGADVALLAAFAFGLLISNVSLSWMTVLGRHSYAIYLVHFAVVSLIAGLVPVGLVPLFVLVSAVSLAFSYYLIEPRIERPFNRLGHALASAGSAPKAVVTTA
ncbi:acyltransferase [Bradyrhizobium lablabi]|uniref:Acyltransferase n=1 Tax=Bradyrhizobium lablabi TaxID=722472 RepID=A0A0R3N4R1_9BRAD|nr:acyltransferase [Bradyrhizobium lablabi]KRR24752.1 acyltransferase [Bradyrhizobium lablabi]